ncbi:TetR/AcrR family transcriptional regulator [Nocardia sp. NPDC048505]|uniref:TetR/AcrR family transcriptional regulator n=1 Tax=unclassified Nocardia TaxID=2637762 RepID=UPI00340824AF
MARPRQFTDDQILDAARDLLADPATIRPGIAAIGRAAGVHTGSIYVRFASREELLARLWLRSIRRFHAGFNAALAGPDPLLAAAIFLTRYCRDHPTEARAMKMFRREDLLEVGPEDLRADIATVNDVMNQTLRAAVATEFGVADERHMAIATAAVKAIPYGMVREFIAVAAPIPDWVDEVVTTATAAVVTELRAQR